ncbi:HAD hydrolase-like protein [bacterium]|nr:HAD hydrolase-like protein [bacterium]MBU1063941.1 HAD hydrolase-like protein [bacterium]MBU1633684.1 HAD hydrolase-like protein [bacterium]MBU1875011.1 HAD hydrolase-like protein [bacterium]
MNKFDPHSDILALDFDGVVVDSIEECLVVGYNALAIQQGKPDRISQLDELDSDIIHEARRIRNFIRHGQDYVYIHYALQQKISIENQQDFDRFMTEHESLNSEFRKHFYTERARFFNDEPETWLALNPFYPGIQEFLEKYQPKDQLYIITTKLKENVEVIINAAKIDIASKNILSADQKMSKPLIIEQLLCDNQLNPSAFHFIDDQVDTLIQAKTTGVNLYLAGWGYNNKDQKIKSRNEQLCVLTLKVFLNKFRS